MLNIIFRADASLEIGSGHVMRCLTLADQLQESGAVCQFICRENPGHLIELIRKKGFEVYSLPAAQAFSKEIVDKGISDGEPLPIHSAWLGCDWQTDADQCAESLKKTSTDWLIIDHYSLDHRWENALKNHYRNLGVIDDLADRKHLCNLLLDQTFGRKPEDYRPLIPRHCKLLLGSRYALLRPEFSQWRNYSLKRRKKPQLKELLITLGGVDKDNATGLVLETLRSCNLPNSCKITVIMGDTAPFTEKIISLTKKYPWSTEVKINVSNMAELMANADLAIGAAGSTTWERCCLGLPTLAIVVADNQKFSTQRLEEKKVIVSIALNRLEFNLCENIDHFNYHSHQLSQMSKKSSSITEGKGAQLVTRELYNLHKDL
jgi:UDP-2,4-diacetamido-2,4,6-trideoxy-beta-L-altropyranose hydrolase